MDFKANIETRESVEAKAKAAFGFDLSSALDLVKRGDYDSDEAYLDACTRAELERSSPEYRAARSRLKVEYQARREEQERKAQSENYKAIRSSVSLDSVDKHNIDEEAAALAAHMADFPHVALKGLMAIPPVSEFPGENCRYFAEMRNLFVDIKAKKYDNVSMECLSMGMSDDFTDAIAEGSTMVRIGTAIFGKRNYNT